jgi:hypothetical protein
MSIGREYSDTLQFITMDATELKALLTESKEFKYQGLDVQDLNKEMLNRGKTKAKKSAGEVMADVRTLCMWIIMRGTNIDLQGKALKSTNPEGRKTIENLIVIYSLKRTGKPKGTTDITMGRIASTYPHIILGIRTSLLINEPSKSLVRLIGLENIAEAARFPTFAALIPLDEEYNEMFDDWLLWANSFDSIINGDKRNDASVLKYAMIMRKNNPMDTKMRRNALVGTLLKDPTLSSEWRKLLE